MSAASEEKGSTPSLAESSSNSLTGERKEEKVSRLCDSAARAEGESNAANAAEEDDDAAAVAAAEEEASNNAARPENLFSCQTRAVGESTEPNRGSLDPSVVVGEGSATARRETTATAAAAAPATSERARFACRRRCRSCRRWQGDLSAATFSDSSSAAAAKGGLIRFLWEIVGGVFGCFGAPRRRREEKM